MSVKIGEFTIDRGEDGILWIGKDDGEGMGLSEKEEQVVEQFLKDFWKEYF